MESETGEWLNELLKISPSTMGLNVKDPPPKHWGFLDGLVVGVRNMLYFEFPTTASYRRLQGRKCGCDQLHEGA